MRTFLTHFLFHSLWIVFSVFIATLSLFLGSLAAARYLHNDLLQKVMRAPMSWFDVTPAGRIINRMSHDVSEVDNDLPATLRAWVSCIFSVFAQIQPNFNQFSYSFLFFCDSFPIGCLDIHFEPFWKSRFIAEVSFLHSFYSIQFLSSTGNFDLLDLE